jgi:hypothetical protein
MADPTDTVELALEDLANEPLPTHTRDHPPPAEDEVQVEYAEADERPAETPRTEPEPREIPAQEGIEELRARLQASDSARRQAEERAAQAEQARVAASGSAQDANVQMLTTALEGTRQQMAVLEANLAESYAVQDFAQAAKIQTEIARTAQRESAIENGLEQLKVMPREQPRQAAADDPVETVARQLTPNAAAWVRSHPEYITDPAKNADLMSAHYAAMAKGLQGDSPDYIRFVESRVLGGREQTIERRETVAENRRSAPPPAPVSRGGNGANNPTRVTLTREQRETAHDNFPDEMAKDPTGRSAEQAYARNMLILQREKRMN